MFSESLFVFILLLFKFEFSCGFGGGDCARDVAAIDVWFLRALERDGESEKLVLPSASGASMALAQYVAVALQCSVGLSGGYLSFFRVGVGVMHLIT